MFITKFIANGSSSTFCMYVYKVLRDAPSDLWGGGEGGQFFCAGFFLLALGLQDFFWPMPVIFLVVALLHYFFLTILPCTIFFGNCPPPSPEI